MSQPSSGIFPKIYLERCSRYRFSYSQCHYCREVCPHDALQLSEQGVELEAGKCANCGLCSSACPTNVFHAAHIPTSKLLQAEKDISVSCLPSQIEAELTVPCLGAIDAVVMSELAQRGIEVTLKGSSHCEECAHAPQGKQILKETLAAVESLCQSMSDDSWIKPRLDNDIKANNGVDRARAGRRQFFRRFLASGVAAAQSNEPLIKHKVLETAVRPAAHYIPQKRKLLSKITKECDSIILNEDVAFTFSVGIVSATEDCSGCEICSRVCPTGALSIHEEDKTWQLHIFGDRCLGCGLCIESCSYNAIELNPIIASAAQDNILHSLYRYRCQSCGRHFVHSDSDLCPVCKDDEESFDAIFN
ncbi:MAG: 4Fe-4S binding protein [Chromatiales bacterium]|nr:4Fe-4S binding protein [Chromatiales bacterium]